MHSIRTKLSLLTILAILVSVLSVGGVSTYSILSEGRRSSSKEMSLICQNLEQSVNEYLDSISQSVDVISRFASEDLNTIALVENGLLAASVDGTLRHERFTPEQTKAIDAILAEHTQRIETLFHSVASHTNGVVSYYYRFNPELSAGVKGFFYTKVANYAFVAQELTDLSAYEEDDVDHVGWFYLPQKWGRASWLPIYENKNIGVKMASYVCPLYKSGVFIGVIGMDIHYDTLVRQVKDAQVYDTGYACLLETDGTIVYHPKLKGGESVKSIFPDNYEQFLANIHRAHSDELLPFSVEGEKKWLAFTTLSNNMKLVVSAPESEINASWYELLQMLGVTAAMILVLFFVLMHLSLGRITEPLRRLTEASRRISAGDYDVELNYKGDDELGILTASFQQLISHLKIYIRDLNSKAYRDALTGVKNKAAFEIFAHKLNDQLQLVESGPQHAFAVVMLDCNNLKVINDRMGHDKGDSFLRTACHHICRIYAHSPVFRMGGDEFVVLLQKEDYLNREELLRLFRRTAAEHNAAVEQPWQRINIAVGMAEYDPETDRSVEEVLKRSDQLMYADKRRMKEEQGPL